MKHIIATLALLCGAAHASGNHDLWFDVNVKYEDVRTKLIPVDDVTQTCNMLRALRNPSVKYDPNVRACAALSHFNSVTICDIYVAKRTSLAILGHEARHCFEGAWHE
jgi:hypothetical protein